MRLSEFIVLTEEEKIRTVIHCGTLIAKRSDLTCKIFLFQVDAIYVEMFCNVTTKQVDEFRFFENTNGLNPYLTDIKIDFN